ncbi:MAG TPA: EamA family transporter RarD [Mycobacteriales bacterium]|nr:EamA family transporter RarD [Mycobacteriales bacterium]
MGDQRRGMVFGVAAYGLWGAFPLYFPLLKPASALEILAHRIVWSLVAVTIVLLALPAMRGPRPSRQSVLRLMVAGCAVSVNWGTYIWAVNHHHTLETSLGYFINPLVTVTLGVVLLRERLRRVQWIAVGLGAVAVAVIAFAYGRPPWIALTLAATFGTYGLVKKQATVSAPVGLFIETATVALPAAVTIAVIGAQGNETFASHTTWHTLAMMSSGIATIIPLLLFAGAAKRLPLVTLGLLQYLAPVLQLLVGVLIQHEPLPASRLVGFILVWVALAVLTVDGWRNRPRGVTADAAVEPPAVLAPEVSAAR